MRILVANSIDDSITPSTDQRAWTQRILWFAEEHDLIVLACEPDETFLRYVTSLTGVDPSTLRFHQPPAGRFDHKLIDPHCLTDPGFIAAVAGDLDEVSEISALWPSAQVARFAEELGLSARFPGADFFAQGGGELANSKANFRAFAAGSGVPIAAGDVCRSEEEARLSMRRLLGAPDSTGAVMVKQAQNAAAKGNELVYSDESLASDHTGAKYIHRLSSAPDSVEEYWRKRWQWASADGRFAVAVEEFRHRATTAYAEFHISDSGVELQVVGGLVYEARRITQEITPLRTLGAGMRDRLASEARKLAELYWTMGYRGYMCADAIVDETGQLFFTEINARVTGSTHIYLAIGQRLADYARTPERTVIQYFSPSTWTVTSFEEFTGFLEEKGLRFDPATRRGVVVSIPPFLPGWGIGRVLFCIVHETQEEQREVYQLLEERFMV